MVSKYGAKRLVECANTTAKTMAGIIISSTNQGLNLVDLLDSVFHLCMHGYTYPAGVVFV